MCYRSLSTRYRVLFPRCNEGLVVILQGEDNVSDSELSLFGNGYLAVFVQSLKHHHRLVDHQCLSPV